MKLKKVIALMMLTFTAVLCFAACNKGNADDTVKSNVVFSPSVDVSILRPVEGDYDELLDLRMAISSLTGRSADIKTDEYLKTKNEIVFGDSNRDVSVEARKLLDDRYRLTLRSYEDDGLDTTFIDGFAIYAKGGSVAIVWTSEDVYKSALDYFVDNYLIGDTLVLDEGYVKVQIFDRIEVLREQEAIEREELYAGIAAEYGADVVKALQNHLSMFDDRYYLWMADLYDPGEYDENGNPLGGGFYYSNSGRDTDGYNIDLESTMQALSWITGASGLFKNAADAREKLPASMVDEIATFVLSCQSSTNGYFYHPQWGEGVSTSRLGRDLSWAVQLIDYCQLKPYWNTPNGRGGYYGEPNGDDLIKEQTVSEYRAVLSGKVSPVALSGKLSSSSAVAAVSKVVPTAKKWNGSSWLATLENWEAYLKSYEADIHSKSYSIGNNFSAQSAQINNRDNLAIENGELPDVRDVYGNPGKDGIADGGYREMWKKYFDSWQYDNGLWEECSLEDGTVYYNAINGLMKISSCYDSLKMPINYAREAFECAVFMVTYFGNGQVTGDHATDWKDSKGKAPTGSVDVYNPWVAMSHILAIVGRTDKALSEELRQITKDNALAMIEATSKKIAKFSKNDGSYGYTWSTSPANSQGAPVAVPNTVEGDVNGGNIAFTGTFGTMRGVLGITGSLKPYSLSDGLIFAERIKQLSPVLKNDDSLLSSESGIRNFDDDAVDSDKAEDVNLTFNKGSAVIVADPEVSGNKYLQFNAVPGDSGNTLSFNAKQETGATCAVLEWRMKFAEPITQNNSTAFQIKLGTSYMLTLAIYSNGTFKLGDSSSTGTGIKNFFDPAFDAYEWNTIRVEYYIIDAESRETVAQIYVNGDLRMVSNNYWSKETDAAPTFTYKSASFFSLRAASCSIYFDDMYAGLTKDRYVEKPVFNPDLVKDFDRVEAGSGKLPNGVTTTGGEVVAEPTEENPDNNIFVLNAKDETVSVAASKSEIGPNCHTVSTKMRIGSSKTGNIGVIYISGGTSAKAIMAYRVNVYDEGGKKLAKLTEYNKDSKTGKTYSGLPTDEWFTLTVDFFPYFYETDACAVLYVNGTELGRGNTYYHIGTIATPYTHFTVTMSADATIALDDITPELVAKKFVDEDGVEIDDPDVELPSSGKSSSTAATADHDGRFDFEGFELGNPKVPGLATSVNTNEYGYYLDIVKDPADAANQCLSHIVVPSSSYGNSATYTASKASPADANCYVFEFDVLIGNGTAGSVQTSLNGSIVASDGSTKSVKLFQTNTNFRGTFNNSTIQITSKRDVAESLGSYTNGAAPKDESKSGGQIIATTKASGWVNIRFELYTEEAKAKIFYDGEYRGETDLVYNNQMKATYTSATIYTTYGSNFELYFDNVIVEAVEKEYVAETCANPTAPVGDGAKVDVPESGEPEGGEPEGGETTGPEYPEGFDGTYTFEGEDVDTLDMYGVVGSFLGGGHANIEQDPRNAAARVLSYKTVNGKGNNYNEYVDFKSYQVDDAKKFIVEWDMKFDEVVSGGESAQIGFGNVYMFSMRFNKDGTFYFADMSSTKGADAWYKVQTLTKSYSTATDKWYNIKIEYSVVDSHAMIKIYIDNTLVAVSDNHYGQNVTSLSDASKFGVFKFRSTQAGAFTVSLDNVKVYTSAEAFVKEEYTHSVHGLIKEEEPEEEKPVEDPYKDPYVVSGAANDFDTTDNITKDTKNPIAEYEVVSDPLGGSNKVLKVTQTSNAAAQDENTFATYNLSEAKSTGIYELSFDMYLDAKLPSNNITILQFVLHSNAGYSMLFSFRYNTDGTFRITQDLKDSSSGVMAELVAKQVLADSKWHNVRFVIEYEGLDSYVSLYVNGVKIARKATYFYNTAVTDGTPISKVTWRFCDNKTKVNTVDTVVMDYYTMYMDDMSFVYRPE